jgi:hypothetical protein
MYVELFGITGLILGTASGVFVLLLLELILVMVIHVSLLI